MALYMRTNGVTKKVGTSSPSAIPASNSTYDNTQSGLSADNVQGAIDEINSDLSELTKNQGGTPIDLLPYNTYENRYIIPSDGYISISSEALSSGDARLVLLGSNDSYIASQNITFAGFYDGGCAFVKKGMRVYVQDYTPGCAVGYVPLV